MHDELVRVFLAEDEAAILRFVTGILQRMGDVCELVGYAQNGADALAEIGRLSPDIVITDIMMPMMDGLELMRRAAQTCPEARFIVLTGHERFDFAQQAIELQAVSYLLKPINVEKLEKTLRDLAVSIRGERRARLRGQLRSMYLSGGRAQEGFRLSGGFLYLLSASLGNREVGHKAATPVTEHSVEALTALEALLPAEAGAACCAFDTLSTSERCVAVMVKQPSDDAVSRLAHALGAVAFPGDGPVTVVVSACVAEETQISAAMEQMRATLAAQRKFAQRSVLWAGADAPQEAAISSKAQEVAKRLYPGAGSRYIAQCAQELVRQWQAQAATCAAICADVEHILSSIRQYAQPGPAWLDDRAAIEGLMQCQDYETLGRTLTDVMICWCAETGQEVGDVEITQEMRLCKRICRYLDTTLQQEFDRSALSAYFGYNKNYLTTLFSKCLGMSPGQYHTKQRIALAKGMIDSKPDGKMQDVAAHMGYADSLYFSRVFKAQTGVSPREYANRGGGAQMPGEVSGGV